MSAASEELAKQHGKYGNEVAELVSRTKAGELFGLGCRGLGRFRVQGLGTLLLFALQAASLLEA